MIQNEYFFAVNRPFSQMPHHFTQIYHSAPFCSRNVHTCAYFCYKMVRCGIYRFGALWDMRQTYCGIVNLVFWVNRDLQDLRRSLLIAGVIVCMCYCQTSSVVQIINADVDSSVDCGCVESVRSFIFCPNGQWCHNSVLLSIFCEPDLHIACALFQQCTKIVIYYISPEIQLSCNIHET